MTQHTFLVEIGTEELPAKALRTLGQAFATNISGELDASSVPYGIVNWFATPRRLAVKVCALGGAQIDRVIEKRGPAIIQAFDVDEKPTKAAESWARSLGITVNQAERLSTDKGKWLVYHAQKKGQPVDTLLFGMVSCALNKLPISKMMRWGSDNDRKFIRPIHTVTMLLDDRIIPGNLAGIDVDRILRGHRFMGELEITLEHADQYPQVLQARGRVIADYFQRKEKIRKHVAATAKQLGGLADLSDSLLEEVTSLVEWPVVLTASFEEKFLMLPMEALVCTMKDHQKYFPVYNAAGNLLPHFIFVANIESKDPQQIIYGNEQVIRPRFADTEFFFNIDRKQRLEDLLPRLDTVVFQNQLGSLRDKSERLKGLAAWIAARLNADVSQAARAGLLSKCDLMTKMVCEFTDTQGVMGMYYARHNRELEAVALAQKEQYQPRFAGDALPTTLVSCALAIADKMDTLTGIFGIGQHPKGDQDPFALRRAALGVLRIIVEKQLSLDLQTLTEEAARLYGDKLINDAVVNDVIDFMLKRFRAWYQEQGHSVDTIQAVLACRPTRPADFDARVHAVSDFRTLKDAVGLAMTHKRIANILAKSDTLVHADLQEAVLKEPAEIRLATHLVALREKLKPLFEDGRYQEALVELASLREPVDAFFAGVMVMSENKKVRVNRLMLLTQLRELFFQVADISLLQ